MTLARCPACQTVFRVRPEQLLAHRGNVRCGQCYASFNALDHLMDEPATSPRARPADAASASLASSAGVPEEPGASGASSAGRSAQRSEPGLAGPPSSPERPAASAAAVPGPLPPSVAAAPNVVEARSDAERSAMRDSGDVFSSPPPSMPSEPPPRLAPPAPDRFFVLEEKPDDVLSGTAAPLHFDVPAAELNPAPALGTGEGKPQDSFGPLDFAMPEDLLMPARRPDGDDVRREPGAEPRGEAESRSGTPARTAQAAAGQREPDHAEWRREPTLGEPAQADTEADRRSREDTRAAAFADRLASKLAERGRDADRFTPDPPLGRLRPGESRGEATGRARTEPPSLAVGGRRDEPHPAMPAPDTSGLDTVPGRASTASARVARDRIEPTESGAPSREARGAESQDEMQDATIRRFEHDEPRPDHARPGDAPFAPAPAGRPLPEAGARDFAPRHPGASSTDSARAATAAAAPASDALAFNARTAGADSERAGQRPEIPEAADDAFALPPSHLRRAPKRGGSLGSPPGSPAMRALQGLAVGVLLGTLAVQSAYVFREEITRQWPALRPAYLAVCEHFGCDVPLPRVPARIAIESSELHADPARPATFVLGANIRNRARYPQAYPHLELTLTDTGDRPLVRRVLEPAEWAGKRVERDNGSGFAPGTEVEFELAFSAAGVKAAGYRLYAFYP